MKRRILLTLVSTIIGLNVVNAQTFSQGEKAIAARVSNFDLEFIKPSNAEKVRVDCDLGLKGDYFVIDNLTVTAAFNYRCINRDNYMMGEIGSKYYYWKYLYGGIFYQGVFDNRRLNSAGKIEAGATLYIAKNVFIEPAIFFVGGKRAFEVNNTTAYSQFGLALSFGVNF